MMTFDTQTSCEEFYYDDAELNYNEEENVASLFYDMLCDNHLELEERIGEDTSVEWIAFCIMMMWLRVMGRNPMEIKGLALEVGEHYNDEP